MKQFTNLLVIFLLIVIDQGLFAQSFSGASGYSSAYDDYLDDFMIHNGRDYQLLREKVLTYPETVFASMLRSPHFTVNPMYLGNEYSSLKFAQDKNENIYLAGIYSQKIINDTSYLFISKLDNKGKNVWTRLFEKQSESINIFIDNSDYLYIHDGHFLYKISISGTLLWVKEHKGTMRLYKNNFYKIHGLNIHDAFFTGQVCDTLLIEKIDSAGTRVFQKVLNRADSTSSMISTNYSLNVIDGRIFLSNSYWGTIDVDPAESNKTFKNPRTSYWGDKWGNIPSFNNYLAVYDTLGDLEIANSKENFPKINYACTDSSGSIYFSGPSSSNTDFIINSDDSLIVSSTSSEKTFIAKYHNNLDFIWIRKLTGSIMYIGTSNYSVGGMEKLDIAGEYEGTINLNLERPGEITFTSQGQDLFYAEYMYLNQNISPTLIASQNQINDLIIYPNPARGFLNIQVGGFDSFLLEIFDLSGKIKFSDFYNLMESTSVDISSLENGLYILKLSNKDKILTDKILINR